MKVKSADFFFSFNPLRFVISSSSYFKETVDFLLYNASIHFPTTFYIFIIELCTSVLSIA